VLRLFLLIEEEVGLPAHLLNHDYFRQIFYENNPNEELSDENEEVEVLGNVEDL